MTWYRWQYNIPPKPYPDISIYEIELELLAKAKSKETQEMLASGKEFFDSELEPEEIEGELDRLIQMQKNMVPVSLDDAAKELGI